MIPLAFVVSLLPLPPEALGLVGGDGSYLVSTKIVSVEIVQAPGPYKILFNPLAYVQLDMG